MQAFLVFTLNLNKETAKVKFMCLLGNLKSSIWMKQVSSKIVKWSFRRLNSFVM